jgi:hypothetical protein
MNILSDAIFIHFTLFLWLSIIKFAFHRQLHPNLQYSQALFTILSQFNLMHILTLSGSFCR